MRRNSSCSRPGWNGWERRFASRTCSITSRSAFGCSPSRSKTTSRPLVYFSNISSLARCVAFTTALMRVTRSLPSSSSRIPSMVQPAGVVTGIELHLRGAEQRLRREQCRDIARQTDLHAGLGERFENDVDECRTTRREAGHRIHVLLVHHHRPAYRVEQPPGGVEMRVRRVLPPADAGHARAHLARRVRHGADHGSRCREQVLDEARRDGGGDRDHELRRGHVRADLLEQLAHVLRFDGDDDHVRSAHRRAIVRSHRNGTLSSEPLRTLRVPHRGHSVPWRQTRLEQPLQQYVPDLPEPQYRHTVLLHRRYSSSKVAASVFSSRYFTITGA